MATDAQISRIEQLTSFAVNLADFSESVTSNSNAFVSLITEKMSELRLTECKADEICQQITQERQKLFNDYASIAASYDLDLRRMLLLALQEAEQKEQIAKRCQAIIHQNVLVAHGAVIAMIDCTKQFNRDTTDNVEKGISFLKQSHANLEQYKSNQNRV